MNDSMYTPEQAYSQALSRPGRYYEWKPGSQLRKYIYCYWMTPLTVLPQPEDESDVEMLVPDGCTDMVVRIDRLNSDIECIVVGTLDRAVSVDMEFERVETWGIRFYPGGLQHFIRESARIFTNRMFDLTEVAKQFASELIDRLHRTSSIEHTLYTLEQYLHSKISNDLVREDTFQNALIHIYQAKGNITVKEIAAKEGISEKQLTRIFYHLLPSDYYKYQL